MFQDSNDNVRVLDDIEINDRDTVNTGIIVSCQPPAGNNVSKRTSDVACCADI